MATPETQSDFQEKNARFVDTFSNDVEQISILSVAVPFPGQSLPKKLPDYYLAPIVPNQSAISMVRQDSLANRIEYSFDLPLGVRVSPNTRSSFLDTGLGVGLAYGHEVIAVAGMGLGLTPDGRTTLLVKQLQGWEHAEERDGHLTGPLHDCGFLWRPTLFRAAIAVALLENFNQAALQSAANNRYTRPGTGNYFKYLARYDAVANELGIPKDPESGNYVVELDQILVAVEPGSPE